MSVPAAYISVIIIWSTTPLAIQWSGDDVGYLFGITSRMTLGMATALLVAAVLGVRLPWHADARRTYLAAGLGMFIAMLAVYRASRMIPSGWIAVIFGLAPMITGLMAHYWLPGKALNPTRVAGMLVGLCGMAMMLVGADSAGPGAAAGIAIMVVSVTAYSASAIAVQRIAADIPALATTVGGLLVTVALLGIVYIASGEPLPVQIPVRAAAAIVYLGVIGSVLGFALYYYILRQVEATRVALITLITPVIALLLGRLLNGEAIQPVIWFGTAVILGGLLLFEYGHVALRRLAVPLAGNDR
jgi:drug/metabolite transporter (DMT)-like permease